MQTDTAGPPKLRLVMPGESFPPPEASPGPLETYGQAIETLSFVRRKTPRGGGRNWWVVPPAPNYTIGWVLGEVLGAEFVRFSLRHERNNDGNCLTFIIGDMVKSGTYGGTEMGFVTFVARALAVGVRP